MSMVVHIYVVFVIERYPEPPVNEVVQQELVLSVILLVQG
jgi:hypothetical protein